MTILTLPWNQNPCPRGYYCRGLPDLHNCEFSLSSTCWSKGEDFFSNWSIWVDFTKSPRTPWMRGPGIYNLHSLYPNERKSEQAQIHTLQHCLTMLHIMNGNPMHK